MGRLYNLHGPERRRGRQRPVRRREEARRTARDITYGQNNEFGFDYLRDNMKYSALRLRAAPLRTTRSSTRWTPILIDEARTPLIICGPAEAASEKYIAILNEVVPSSARTSTTTSTRRRTQRHAHRRAASSHAQKLERGRHASRTCTIPSTSRRSHILNQCLRAHASTSATSTTWSRRTARSLIIDEFTGRVLAGRRWCDGLHQAVEAKEHVRDPGREPHPGHDHVPEPVPPLQQAGRHDRHGRHRGRRSSTSTYKLDVVVIPTNKTDRARRRRARPRLQDRAREVQRADAARSIDVTTKRAARSSSGTTSVEKSDAIARILEKKSIPHNVLNAKHHEHEAYVVAQAGRKGAITVATNMAGRGTDILLGGNPEMLARLEVSRAGQASRCDAEPEEFAEGRRRKYRDELQGGAPTRCVEAGGLHILGTERHESRRIDNQLRGRAGRQGDPGYSTLLPLARRRLDAHLRRRPRART